MVDTKQELYNVGGVMLSRPFKIRRLGHFGFNLSDMPAGLHFYRDLLGFKVSDELDFKANPARAEMLKDVGCSYVIVGHSERREDHGESNSDVAKKASKALACGLTPIICIGEPLAVREAGEVEAFLSEQLKALVEHLSVDDLSKSVIAYEPIWAIGTGKTASPEQAQDVHKFIREFFANEDKTLAEGLRILYGGSVKPDNAKTLFAQADVDGGLIGGASLKVEDFISICQAAN